MKLECKICKEFFCLRWRIIRDGRLEWILLKVWKCYSKSWVIRWYYSYNAWDNNRWYLPVTLLYYWKRWIGKYNWNLKEEDVENLQYL